MSKTIRRNEFQFDYQYQAVTKQQRKQVYQQRQERKNKHSRFDFLNAAE